MPQSSRLMRVCRTVVMMVAPPGDPTARSGRPLRRTIVGAIEDRGRLRPASWVAPRGLVPSGPRLKSVSSLLSRKPKPGTTMPLPPVCSIVKVYSTTLPALSGTVMFVVEPTRVADALVSAGAGGALSVGSPAGTAPAGGRAPRRGARPAAGGGQSRARDGPV